MLPRLAAHYPRLRQPQDLHMRQRMAIRARTRNRSQGLYRANTAPDRVPWNRPFLLLRRLRDRGCDLEERVVAAFYATEEPPPLIVDPERLAA